MGSGLLIAFLSSMLLAQDKSPDWPQFRGPGGLGIGKSTELPMIWSPNENVLWKTKLTGAGASSPIVVNNRVFLTSYTGAGERLLRQVHCFNMADGKLLWTREVKAAVLEQPLDGSRVELHGYASSTPVADGERLYVFFGSSGVVAFDYSGRQLWQTGIGTGRHRYGSGTSPVLHRDLLIVNASVERGALIALNRRTGQMVWQTPGIAESWNTPLVVDLPDGGSEVVVTIRGWVIGVDPANGQRLWQCRGVEDYMVPSTVAHEGVVYALLGRDGTVLAVRAGGRGDVSNSHVLWRVSKGRNIASPVYYQGHLYFVTENIGVVRCLDAKTGQTVYEQRLNPAPGDIYASPLVADGKLFILSRERGAFVLAAGSKFQLLAHNDLGDRSRFSATPAVVGDRLLLRSDEYLYCLGRK